MICFEYRSSGASRMEALLGLYVGLWLNPLPYSVFTTVVQQDRDSHETCGWIGVAVAPMTASFATSLGMIEPYGAIFDQPETGSPAAKAHIEQGDVLTSVNGSPLRVRVISRSSLLPWHRGQRFTSTHGAIVNR